MENTCNICKNANTLKLVYPKNIDASFFSRPYSISDSDYGKHRDIYKCSSCNVYSVDISDVADLIASYYGQMDDEEYDTDTPNRAKAFTRILRMIKKYKPHGKLLDIGCATGTFLNEAQKTGYDVYGIDPSDWAVKTAIEKYNLKNVSKALIQDFNFADDFFDVIVLTDVIEHVPNPVEVLNKVHRLLNKGGLLCIVTPNIDGIFPKTLGERWWHIRIAHLYYFSKRTMVRTLENTGFKVLKTRDYVWYLGFNYILKRLLKFAKLSKLINTDRLPNFVKSMPVPINLGDSMEVYAQK